MGKFIVIKNADFSNVSVEVVTPTTLDISITSAGSVTISDDAATAIYYTIDGSTPTTSSTQYTGAFNVSSGTTVKAISLYATGSTSVVVSKEYIGSTIIYTRSEMDELETLVTHAFVITSNTSKDPEKVGNVNNTISYFNYVVIPVTGYSRVIFNGWYAKAVACFYNSNIQSHDYYVGECATENDADLSDAEYSIPSGAKYIAVNLSKVYNTNQTVTLL